MTADSARALPNHLAADRHRGVALERRHARRRFCRPLKNVAQTTPPRGREGSQGGIMRYPSFDLRTKTHGLIPRSLREIDAGFSTTCSHRASTPLIHGHRTNFLRLSWLATSLLPDISPVRVPKGRERPLERPHRQFQLDHLSGSATPGRQTYSVCTSSVSHPSRAP